jgi:hypothetical protein
MVPADFNHFPDFRVAWWQKPFLKTVWLLEGNAVNPTFSAGEGTFQDGDAGISR